MKVTVDDLIDWERENEENVYMDGPYYLSDEQEKELGEITFDRMNKLRSTNHKLTPNWKFDDSMSMYDLWSISEDSDEWGDIVLQSLCDIINKYDIEPS